MAAVTKQSPFKLFKGCHGPGRMVVRFTTTCVISSYHH